MCGSVSKEEPVLHLFVIHIGATVLSSIGAIVLSNIGATVLSNTGATVISNYIIPIWKHNTGRIRII
jgi:hypothetical protein